MNENHSIMASVKGMEMQRWATFTVENLKLNWHKVFGLWKAHFSGKVVNMDSSENKRTFPISINTGWYQGLADDDKKHCLITLILRDFFCSLQRISRSTFQTMSFWKDLKNSKPCNFLFMFDNFHFFTQWTQSTCLLLQVPSICCSAPYCVLRLNQVILSKAYCAPLQGLVLICFMFLLKMPKGITANNFWYYFQLERKEVIL